MMDFPFVRLFAIICFLASGRCFAEDKVDCKTLEGHKGRVRCATFSSDGKRLASGSDDGTIIVWRVGSGKQELTLDEGKWEICDLVFCFDDEIIISSTMRHDARTHRSIGRLRWWNLSKKQIEREKTFSDSISCFCLSPDHKLLATDAGITDNTDVKLWNAETGKDVATLQGAKGYPSTLAFSRDGSRLAVGCRRDRKVVVWDVNAQKPVTRYQLEEMLPTSLAWSPDGASVAVGGEQSPISIFYVEKQKEVVSIDENSTCEHGLAYLNDGKILAAVRQSVVTMIDVSTGERRRDCRLNHGETIQCLAIGQKGVVATAGDAGTLKLWHILFSN